MTVLLSAQHIAKSYGTRELISDFTLSIEEPDRLALIGANGCGKSTILKILARQEEADDGQVIYRRELGLAFVPQNVTLSPTDTVMDVMNFALQHLDEVERSIRISRWLSKVSVLEPSRKVEHLSGGQKKRLQLLAAFAQEPDVILLDEPTNHLDVDAILWLEELFETTSASIIFVSHDRYLIETQATRVVEMAPWYPNGYLHSEGSYSDFLENRASFLSVRERTHASLANKARRELEWLRRGPKAQRKKSKSRVSAAKDLISEVKSYRAPGEKAGFDFAQGQRKSHDLIRVSHLGHSIGGNDLFKNFSTTLSPGIRLGVVGPNGSGKSTLLKVLGGMLEPAHGKVVTALGCRIVYFDQHRRLLNHDLTLRQALCPDGDSVSFNGKLVHVSSWAQRFLFRPDQLGRRLGELSGGELARAVLAHLMREPADVLLLDEPTNDLDIPTLEVLEEALTEFHGAIALVSHDRYFLDRVCTGLIAIEHGAAEPFASYSQWEEERSTRENIPTKKLDIQRKDSSAETAEPKQRKPLTYAERIELDKIESKILKAEEALGKLQSELNDPKLVANAALLKEHCIKLEEARKKVEELYARWEFLDQKAR